MRACRFRSRPVGTAWPWPWLWPAYWQAGGIALFSWLAIRAGLAKLPEGVSWRVLAAGGVLAGIGFTMSLFIAELAH